MTTLSTKKNNLLDTVGTWSVTQYNGEYVSAAADVGSNTNKAVGTSYAILEVNFANTAADIDFADGLFTMGSTYKVLADTDVTAWTISDKGVATETTLSSLEKLA